MPHQAIPCQAKATESHSKAILGLLLDVSVIRSRRDVVGIDMHLDMLLDMHLDAALGNAAKGGALVVLGQAQNVR